MTSVGRLLTESNTTPIIKIASLQPLLRKEPEPPQSAAPDRLHRNGLCCLAPCCLLPIVKDALAFPDPTTIDHRTTAIMTKSNALATSTAPPPPVFAVPLEATAPTPTPTTPPTITLVESLKLSARARRLAKGESPKVALQRAMRTFLDNVETLNEQEDTSDGDFPWLHHFAGPSRPQQ